VYDDESRKVNGWYTAIFGVMLTGMPLEKANCRLRGRLNNIRMHFSEISW
jgi:hypothetical protein